MKLTTEKINELLGVDDAYKAPEALMNILKNKDAARKLFEKLLAIETDLSFDWFHEYFQEEHADRKQKKQDFTPNSVGKVLSLILGHSESTLDVAAGTGGLTIKKWWNDGQPTNNEYLCEELSDRAVPFLLFNLMIRGMKAQVIHGDSLSGVTKKVYKISDYELTEINEELAIEKVDAVISNPPYSAKWDASPTLLDDPRFSHYEKLAPKTKADFAFLLHGFYRLKDSGTMAVVLPHGVLFRGAAEGVIRKKLLEDGSIDAVIGLPANLFFGTSIPTVVIVLKKNRQTRDVMFIDSSKEFDKGKNQNSLSDDHINKIIHTYKERKDIEKYAHLASYDEITENDFNLNIPRFVDTFEEEEPINPFELLADIRKTSEELAKAEKELVSMLDELVVDTDESRALIQATKEVFGNG
ncbi:N-6 DNA methylase [Enterococcus faecalis]|nr:N-6 DNA methylase [Enterococcus faecalis]EHZ9324024.1 N-6 DNA methylase [Enterococcus faecalis]NSU82264.1 N-6 DNA methylase [Enterococcus faecalis]NSV42314.1 N-6 DNA methylase [Enterococcus faecalis]